MFSSIIVIIQLFFTVITGLYFLSQLRNQREDKSGINEDSKHIMERLNAMRRISLTKPLTEETRPSSLDEIIGQDDGVEALKIALCGKNPQHVIIYGPPGVGKTAASRVAMEFAKNSNGTPFKRDAKFIEVDATIMQYDERSIADPLIGSVHDPIYQGAGAYGPAGVPQPKEGAVSKAHGGILFIDEIGELQNIQINRLLKVLEDRRVKFESSYYSSGNKNIPRHIHDIFQNGIPADFRLIGATTRNPEEIPPAIRSRCTEIFFNSLKKQDILKIIDNTLKKLDIKLDDECKELICNYASNGRDTVSILQTLSSLLELKNKTTVDIKDIEWVLESGHYSPVYNYLINNGESVGRVHALAITHQGDGLVIPIEATASKRKQKSPSIRCGGITENETIKKGNQSLTRTSTAKTAVNNVFIVLSDYLKENMDNFDININIPGGVPIDGPSAGIAMFLCCYSAITNTPVPNTLCITGEISIKGEVLPVGGVRSKINAGISSGADTVIIPKANYCEQYERLDINIVPVSDIFEIISYVKNKSITNDRISINNKQTDLAIAEKI